MQEIKKPEEELNDNVGDTLPPDEHVDTNDNGGDVQLNNTPVPTDEQVDDGISEDINVEDDHEVIENPSPDMTDEQKAVEKLFNQKELNDIVGQRVMETKEKTLRGVLDHYGCDNQDALDTLVGDGQRFPMLKEELEGNKKSSEARISELEKSLSDVSSELALFKSNISPDRYEDVKLILSGKGLDINSDNIKKEMVTHPEWENKPIIEKPDNPANPVNPVGGVMDQFEKIPSEPEEKVSKISRLGNGKSNGGEENEHDAAMSYFDI